ncbi:hypothetical protein DW141_08445 [Ruminococcus sp. AM12-48]|nr:hypothetical protein DW141_08445 [Ruminococcus sp. AM12-48]
MESWFTEQLQIISFFLITIILKRNQTPHTVKISFLTRITVKEVRECVSLASHIISVTAVTVHYSLDQ